MILPIRLGVGLTVEFKNPRTLFWEPISSWGSEDAAKSALQFYLLHDYEGWESAKLSKSRQV